MKENWRGKRGELITLCRAWNGALFGSEQWRNRRMVRLWSWGVEEVECAKDKEAGAGERGEEVEEKKEEGGCRRRVLISSRLFVMRSLYHCSQIDVMWSSVVHREACRGWQACMTRLLTCTGTHKHTSTHAERVNTLIHAGKCLQANKPAPECTHTENTNTPGTKNL